MKCRKKPVVIEAVQFTRNNWEEIHYFTNGNAFNFFEDITDCKHYCLVQTLEGIVTATEGDYIIKGVNGEFYPCKPDIFEKTYDAEEMMENKDDLTKALNGLQTFTENWCMDVEETEKQDEPVFRCKECPFENDGYCKIKEFGKKHDYELGCMRR